MPMNTITANSVLPVRFVIVHTTSQSTGIATTDSNRTTRNWSICSADPRPGDHELVPQLVEVLGGQEPLQEPDEERRGRGQDALDEGVLQVLLALDDASRSHRGGRGPSAR